MQTALSKLHVLMNANDWVGALHLASRWPDLGEQKDDICRGWAAHSNPDFYRQINKDPDALFVTGVDALKARYCGGKA